MKLLKTGSIVRTKLARVVFTKVERTPRHGANTHTYELVETTPIDDPACARDENDLSSAFAQFLLPKVEHAKDDASKEVREYLKVEGLADAVAHTIQALPASKTRQLRAWTEQALSTRIYRQVKVFVRRGARNSGAYSEFGLILTTGGARDALAPIDRGRALGGTTIWSRTHGTEDFQDIASPDGVQLPGDPAYEAAIDKQVIRIADAWLYDARGDVDAERAACKRLRAYD